MRFNKLDLNLLVALDALLKERSISRAAEQLHLSQSAMQSTKIIAESLGKWKGGADWTPRTAPR